MGQLSDENKLLQDSSFPSFKENHATMIEEEKMDKRLLRFKSIYSMPESIGDYENDQTRSVAFSDRITFHPQNSSVDSETSWMSDQ